ncbi:MAG: hypothetical protein E7638_04100 [Ruminococcaceae bacterium]|nr:hypothetical protein [Oscillospiraceae bacterium]
MKKVLLLGDTIRVSYQERVKELLSDVAEVVFPHHNSGYSAAVLWYLREQFVRIYQWGEIDVVHWNTGLWDHHRTLDDGLPLITAEEYLHINRRLHKQLEFYSKKQVFATTLPAGDSYKYDKNSIYGIPKDEWNREIAEYNAVLVPYLQHHGVKINDLYSTVSAHPEYLGEDGISLSEEGVEEAAQQIAASIRLALAEGDEAKPIETKSSPSEKAEAAPYIDWEYTKKR